MDCVQSSDSPLNLVPEPILGEPDPGAVPMQPKPGVLFLGLEGERERLGKEGRRLEREDKVDIGWRELN